MTPADVRQRIRVTFGVAGPLRYASVLDLGRLWERLLRRARVPLAYSHGFSPHPRLQFAAALPVGYSSDCELLDLLLAECIEPSAFAGAVALQRPQGLSVLHVAQVPVEARSPQALMRAAHYRVQILTAAPPMDMEAALDSLLASSHTARRRLKKGQMREYDLRPLIYELGLSVTAEHRYRLDMVLACGPSGAGRPEEVVDALGLPVSHYEVRRVGLIWGDDKESVP